MFCFVTLAYQEISVYITCNIPYVLYNVLIKVHNLWLISLMNEMGHITTFKKDLAKN